MGVGYEEQSGKKVRDRNLEITEALYVILGIEFSVSLKGFRDYVKQKKRIGFVALYAHFLTC